MTEIYISKLNIERDIIEDEDYFHNNNYYYSSFEDDYNSSSSSNSESNKKRKYSNNFSLEEQTDAIYDEKDYENEINNNDFTLTNSMEKPIINECLSHTETLKIIEFLEKNMFFIKLTTYRETQWIPIEVKNQLTSFYNFSFDSENNKLKKEFNFQIDCDISNNKGYLVLKTGQLNKKLFLKKSCIVFRTELIALNKMDINKYSDKNHIKNQIIISSLSINRKLEIPNRNTVNVEINNENNNISLILKISKCCNGKIFSINSKINFYTLLDLC
jgi:hypothetical protein